MHTLTWRRLAAALAAVLTIIAAMASFPPPASAAPSVRYQSMVSSVTDMEVATTSGLAVVDLYLATSRGGVALFGDDRSDLRALTGDDFVVRIDGATATGSGPLYDALTGEPLADVSFVLQVDRTGTHVDRFRKSIGNRAHLQTDTVTTLVATGTLTLLDQAYPVSGSGQEVVFDEFWNAPASEVGRGTSGTLDAVVAGPDGRTVSLMGGSDQFVAAVFDASGELLAVASAPDDTTVLGNDGLHGVLLVDDLSGGQPVERTVDVPGRLDNDKVRTVEQRPKGEVHLTTQTLVLDGVLDLGPGLAFTLDGVQATWEQSRWVYQSQGS